MDEILGIPLRSDLVSTWRGWFAPPVQPFLGVLTSPFSRQLDRSPPQALSQTARRTASARLKVCTPRPARHRQDSSAGSPLQPRLTPQPCLLGMRQVRAVQVSTGVSDPDMCT